MFTSLTAAAHDVESSDVGVSSLMDTWVMLRNTEVNGERTRQLVLLKSRGMEHSNEVREFLLSNDGIRVVDVFVDEGRVLTGRARRTAGDKEHGHRPPGTRSRIRQHKE
jgi:circadian clock protein KaiC